MRRRVPVASIVHRGNGITILGRGRGLALVTGRKVNGLQIICHLLQFPFFLCLLAVELFKFSIEASSLFTGLLQF
jgi:hypothetical protein